MSAYLPFYELRRDEFIESVHHGAIAVVDIDDRLVAWFGNPDQVTFMRSSAKPFQALPFIEHGGIERYALTLREVAIMCASHSGTDEHMDVLRAIQKKTGVSEQQLLCGVHEPFHKPTLEAMLERKEKPTSNRHNCSGKHTGMLAFTRLRGDDSGIAYIDPRHPIQVEILRTLAEMSRLPAERIALGVDGCSAPNFAIPLRNAALAYARLCDPERGEVKPPGRARACQTVVSAMTAHPDMVAGPDRFDTRLMEIAQGRLVVKGGAEGYQGIGLMPGALHPGSPAIGIAFKVADGDARGKIRSAVAPEVLRQLNALSAAEFEALSEFGPGFPVLNWRKIVVGQGSPAFRLNWAG